MRDGCVRRRVGGAPAAWGMTEKQYKDKADLWPLNPNGELLVFVIIESKEGIANAREIMSVPGIAAVMMATGTPAATPSARIRSRTERSCAIP